MIKRTIILSWMGVGCGLASLGAQEMDVDLNPVTPVAVEKEGRQTYVGFAGMWVDNNTDGSVGGALRLGWNFAGVAPYFISTDVEVEASYWQADRDASYGVEQGTAKTKNLPAMVNLRVNVPLSDTGLLLYGGGGLGISYLDVEGTSALGQTVDDTGAVFTYSFFAGIGVGISDQVSLRAGYRALWLTDDTFNDASVKVTLDTERNDIFELSLRLDF